MAALTNGVSIKDVTLTGDVTSIAGSDTKVGMAVLLAKGANESRVEFTFSGDTRTEVRSSTNGFPLGTWAGSDGVNHYYASQNCWTDAAWFFPALSAISGLDPTVVLTYVGLESRNGVSVQHLQSYRYVSAKRASTTLLIQQESTIDFYLDVASFLPVSILFNVHPDNNSTVNIPVEVDFSNYQATNGAQVPRHIQQYVQGTLALDLLVTRVTLNSGLPDSAFNIQ